MRAAVIFLSERRRSGLVTVKEDALRILAIAPRAARLLVERLDRLGHAEVEHEAHVRLMMRE